MGRYRALRFRPTAIATRPEARRRAVEGVYERSLHQPASPSRLESNAMPNGLRDGTGSAGTGLATRKPTSKFSNDGSSKFWLDAARMNGLLMKPPARRPRPEPNKIASFHSNTFPSWSKVPFGLAAPV